MSCGECRAAILAVESVQSVEAALPNLSLNHIFNLRFRPSFHYDIYSSKVAPACPIRPFAGLQLREAQGLLWQAIGAWIFWCLSGDMIWIRNDSYILCNTNTYIHIYIYIIYIYVV